MGEKTFICCADHVEAGKPFIGQVRSLFVGVFRVDEAFHAFLNACPPRGALLCKGPQGGITAPVDEPEFMNVRDNDIVRCAWHGWELTSVRDNPKLGARAFPVTPEGWQRLCYGLGAARIWLSREARTGNVRP